MVTRFFLPEAQDRASCENAVSGNQVSTRHEANEGIHLTAARVDRKLCSAHARVSRWSARRLFQLFQLSNTSSLVSLSRRTTGALASEGVRSFSQPINSASFILIVPRKQKHLPPTGKLEEGCNFVETWFPDDAVADALYRATGESPPAGRTEGSVQSATGSLRACCSGCPLRLLPRQTHAGPKGELRRSSVKVGGSQQAFQVAESAARAAYQELDSLSVGRSTTPSSQLWRDASQRQARARLCLLLDLTVGNSARAR